MIRFTRQRRAIERAFAAEKRPLSPTEVFAAASRELPGIGLRTVYRQLRDMANQGIVVGVDYPGQPLRYEWVNHAHRTHFICRRCQRVFDLEIEIPETEIRVPEGFSLTGQETILYGSCPDCSARL